MWLGEVSKRAPSQSYPLVGTVTVGGEDARVMSHNQVTAQNICAPGGIKWLPRENEDVMCLPDSGGKTIIGAINAPDEDIAPGDIKLHSGNGAIILKTDGSIVLRGRVSMEGSVYINGNEITAG